MAEKLPTATAEHPELYVDTGTSEQSAAEKAAELAQARHLAERYRLPFLDLAHFNIDHDLFRTIPAELMLRYGFVPYGREGAALVIVVLIPLALRGVRYTPSSAAQMLRRNLLVYGAGGIVAPFIGIKIIDLLIAFMGVK